MKTIIRPVGMSEVIGFGTSNNVRDVANYHETLKRVSVQN